MDRVLGKIMNKAQTSKNDVKTSKFLSFILRHKPDAIALRLNSEGWADIDALILCAAAHGKKLAREQVLRVAAESDKQRFAISDDGSRIRAVQGHSTKQVDISFTPETPPDTLFHGTAGRCLPSILEKGLLPGKRHYVHLSTTRATAKAVGERHGKPVVLIVDAAAMSRDGAEFYLSENSVWLTKAVPAQYLKMR